MVTGNFSNNLDLLDFGELMQIEDSGFRPAHCAGLFCLRLVYRQLSLIVLTRNPGWQSTLVYFEVFYHEIKECRR